MTTTRKELNFKRCYVNGKKSGVASYDNGGAALLYFGHSLGDGLGEVAAKKLGQEAGTLHQFNNYIELSAATVAGIQAVLPGAVVEFEGSKEYNARVLAAVGSRGGSSSSVVPAPVVVSSDAFRAPVVDDCDALKNLIGNMPGVVDAVNAWAVDHSAAVLGGGSAVVVPECVGAVSQFVPGVVDAFGAFDVLVHGAIKEYQEKQAAERAARETAERIAAAAATAAANGKNLVTLPDGSTVEAAGRVHKEFTRVCQLVKRGLNVYLYGPAGTGKTHLCKQISDALGVKFFSDQKISDDFKLTGFVDANGKFQETELYRAVTCGGVYMLDEFDASDENAAIVLNTLMANGYMTFPGVGRVEVHPDFHVIACGNTLGRGADSDYTGRNCLDAATLDRFMTVQLDYDEEIELLKANGDKELLKFIHEVRKAVKTCGISMLATMRAIDNITKIKDCFSPVECLKMGLVKGLEIDQLKVIAEACKGSGKWFDALKELAA